MEYLKESVSWSGSTNDVSDYKLFLDADRYWLGCEITLEGELEKKTVCNLFLLVDGKPLELIKEVKVILEGNETLAYCYIINKKCSISVEGHIKSDSDKGAGAKITLTGVYVK